MRERPQPQQINHHHLAVVIPSKRQKAELGGPAVRQQRSVLGEPAPIHTIEDLVCQKSDFGMFLEVLPAGENSAEQDGRVDGGDFGIPDALASINVGEVVEKPSMRGHFFPEEAQSRQNAVSRLRKRNKPALLSDAEGGQAKSRSRNTADIGVIIDQHIASILNQPSLRACLFPEILKVQLLKFVQELVIPWRQRVCDRRSLRVCWFTLNCVHQRK